MLSRVATNSQTLSGLPLAGVSGPALRRLRVLAQRLVDDTQLDRVAAKDAATFLQTVADLEDALPGGEPMDEELTEALLDAVKRHEFDPELLKMFDRGAQHGRRKPSGRRRTSSEDSDDDADSRSVSAASGEPPRAATRQLPARRARAAARQSLAVAKSVSSSESEDTSGSGSEEEGAHEHGERPVSGDESNSDDDFQSPRNRWALTAVCLASCPTSLITFASPISFHSLPYMQMERASPFASITTCQHPLVLQHCRINDHGGYAGKRGGVIDPQRAALRVPVMAVLL